MFNYKVAIFFGCYSAITTVLAILVCMVVILVVCWQMHKENQRTNANARNSEKLLQHLVIKDYDPLLFPLNVECSVCISDFEKDQKVCPLPCNKLHLFHHECILKWLSREDFDDICPLCKKKISDQECIELSYNFHKIYPKE